MIPIEGDRSPSSATRRTCASSTSAPRRSSARAGSPERESSSARRTTCPPSRRAGSRSITAPTSTRSASSCTRCSPAACRSRPTRTWACSPSTCSCSRSPPSRVAEAAKELGALEDITLRCSRRGRRIATQRWTSSSARSTTSFSSATTTPTLLCTPGGRPPERRSRPAARHGGRPGAPVARRDALWARRASVHALDRWRWVPLSPPSRGPCSPRCWPSVVFLRREPSRAVDPGARGIPAPPCDSVGREVPVGRRRGAATAPHRYCYDGRDSSRLV